MNEGPIGPYAEKYTLFSSWKAALAYAKTLGWNAWRGFDKEPPRPGVARIFSCGDVDLKILCLEVKE